MKKYNRMCIGKHFFVLFFALFCLGISAFSYGRDKGKVKAEDANANKIYIKLYDMEGQPLTTSVMVFKDIKRDCIADAGILDSEDYTPELELVSGAIKEVEPGKYEILKTHIKPLWIRALLPIPGLGKIWFSLDPKGYSFDSGVSKEIDGIAEIEKNLINVFNPILNGGVACNDNGLVGCFTRQLLKDGSLAYTDEPNAPEKRYKNIYKLSSLKSSIADSDIFSIWYSPVIEKVGLDEGIPEKKLEFIPLDIARNEYESFQLVIRPKQPLENVSIVVQDAVTEDGNVLKGSEFKVFRVGYVRVVEATDAFGQPNKDYPDPIIPLNQPVTLSANENAVFLFRLKSSPSQPSGIYKGKIEIKTSQKTVEVPYQVQVYAYTLPDTTSTEIAYGVYPDYAFHGPLNEEQKKEVFGLYMDLCAEYRISPYSPHAFAPIQWVFEGEPPEPKLDFSEFDKAMEKYLDQYHFTSFNMGGLPRELNGAEQYSPEYVRLFTLIFHKIQEHLREKGWLHKAYWYWVDEPMKESYPGVKQGLELLKSSCPEIRRLLTLHIEQTPAPDFYNLVNLWVPIAARYDAKRAWWRQELGEQVWWYVCTGPRCPYANNFIDHPGINHRIRFWQADKYGLDGDLYWSLTYWVQNPWEQAMSIPPDGKGTWGNGDGRLLYPPQPQKPTEPLVAPSIPSLRLELLRDGIEDREPLVFLSQIQHARNGYNSVLARKVRSEVLNNLISSLTVYEQNPFLFYLNRLKLLSTASTLFPSQNMK